MFMNEFVNCYLHFRYLAKVWCVIMLFAVNWIYKAMAGHKMVSMDDHEMCGQMASFRLKDDESTVIMGKAVADPATDISTSAVKQCRLMVGPSMENKRKYLRLKFESFYINDCGIHLEIRQSASDVFTRSGEMASLSCDSYSPTEMYTKEGHNLMFTLQRDEAKTVDYNFRINVTTTEEVVQSHAANLGLIIGASAGGILLMLILMVLIYKCCCSTSSSEKQKPPIGSESPSLTYIPVSRRGDGESGPAFVDRPPSVNIPLSDRGMDVRPPDISAQPLLVATQTGMNCDTEASDTPPPDIVVLNVPSSTDPRLSHAESTRSRGSDNVESELPPAYDEALCMPKPEDLPTLRVDSHAVHVTYENVNRVRADKEKQNVSDDIAAV